MISDIIKIVLNIALIIFSMYVLYKIIKNKSSIKFILFYIFIAVLVIYNCVVSTVYIMLPEDTYINIMTGFTKNIKYAYAMLVLQTNENITAFIYIFMMFYVIYKLCKTIKSRILEIKHKNKK